MREVPVLAPGVTRQRRGFAGEGSAAVTELERRLVDVLRALVPGEVVSYGDVAGDAGFPGRARAVGRLLSTWEGDELPWWRVVTSTGRLAPGHEREQAARLRAEGVAVRDGRVVRSALGRFARDGR